MYRSGLASRVRGTPTPIDSRVMTEPIQDKSEVDQFILGHIESVSHLEALLLVWRSRPKMWTVDELALLLYVKPEVVHKTLGRPGSRASPYHGAWSTGAVSAMRRARSGRTG